MKTIWDDLFDEDMLAGINAKLRAAQRVADKQAFGMVRAERAVEFVNILNSAKADIERIVKRVEALK